MCDSPRLELLLRDAHLSPLIIQTVQKNYMLKWTCQLYTYIDCGCWGCAGGGDTDGFCGKGTAPCQTQLSSTSPLQGTAEPLSYDCWTLGKEDLGKAKNARQANGKTALQRPRPEKENENGKNVLETLERSPLQPVGDPHWRRLFLEGLQEVPESEVWAEIKTFTRTIAPPHSSCAFRGGVWSLEWSWMWEKRKEMCCFNVSL